MRQTKLIIMFKNLIISLSLVTLIMGCKTNGENSSDVKRLPNYLNPLVEKIFTEGEPIEVEGNKMYFYYDGFISALSSADTTRIWQVPET
jgi:hypothetical protein